VRTRSLDDAAASSALPSARFPGVAIYLAEPRMGRSRRAFLTRLARSKGFRVLDAYRCATTLPIQDGPARGIGGGPLLEGCHPRVGPPTAEAAEIRVADGAQLRGRSTCDFGFQVGSELFSSPVCKGCC
jgi:hypothetical protein